MSEKSEKFFDAITHIREDLVEEAQNHRFHKKSTAWKRFASLAASIVLIVSIGFLAIVPRGCGSGGNSSGGADSSPHVSFDSVMNNAGAPQGPVSSEQSPPMGGISGSSGAEPGDTPGADAPEGVAPADGTVLHQFTAIIIEIQNGDFLVETVDTHDQYLVSTALIDCTDLSEGDWITVTYSTYSGPGLTTNPPTITNVKSIDKIDPAE